MKSKIVYALINIIIVIIFLMYLPQIQDNVYSFFRVALFVIFVVAFLLATDFSKTIKNKVIIRFILAIIYSLLLVVVGMFLNGGQGPYYELTIAFLAIVIGSALSDIQIKKIINVFIFLVAILGLISTYYYFGGFIIHQQYLAEGKNQLGVLYGSASTLSLFCFLNKEKRKHRFIYLGLFALLVMITLANRNRTIILGLIVVSSITIILNFKKIFTTKRASILLIVTIPILAITLMLGAFDNLFDFIQESIFLNFDSTDLNSISAGRLDGYSEALEYIIKYPVFGIEFRNINTIHTPHNYFINKIMLYGIIGSFPFILLTLYITYFSLKRFSGNYNKRPIYLLFTLIIIVSMFEYSYPYGPGTNQIILWIIIGNELSFREQKSKANSIFKSK